MALIEVRGLDLFACAGGATRGYLDAARAYGEVRLTMVGVDKRPVYGYPDSGGSELLIADAFDVLECEEFVRSFDFIHASPPCQIFSQLRHLPQTTEGKVDLLTPLRPFMERYGDMRWVLENVERCNIMRADLFLCGSQFPHLRGVDERRQLRRHRKFELQNIRAPWLYCRHNGYRPLGVYGIRADNIPGGGSTAGTLEEGRKLMGIDWMQWKDLVEAIPPAYTQHIGKYMFQQIIEEKAA